MFVYELSGSEFESSCSRLNGYVYDFSVDYKDTAVDDILDIHKYLMKKMIQYKTFEFVKQIFISAMMFFGCNLSSVNPLKCISEMYSKTRNF